MPILEAHTSWEEAGHQLSLSGLTAVPVAMPEGWFALLTATQIIEAQTARVAELNERLRQRAVGLATLAQTLRSPLAAIECQCELIRWQFAHSLTYRKNKNAFAQAAKRCASADAKYG